MTEFRATLKRLTDPPSNTQQATNCNEGFKYTEIARAKWSGIWDGLEICFLCPKNQGKHVSRHEGNCKQIMSSRKVQQDIQKTGNRLECPECDQITSLIMNNNNNTAMIKYRTRMHYTTASLELEFPCEIIKQEKLIKCMPITMNK